MEMRFDASQEYQIKAVEAIVGLFDGQRKIEPIWQYVQGSGFVGSSNKLDIDESNPLLSQLHI